MRAALVASGLAVAMAVTASAQETTRLGRCFTPAGRTGVYFDVTADGPLAQALLQPRAHRHGHVTVPGRVQVPDPEPLEHPLPVHRMGLRSADRSPLLEPQPRSTTTTHSRASHRHASVFDLSPLPDSATAVDVVRATAEGATGCRLRFR